MANYTCSFLSQTPTPTSLPPRGPTTSRISQTISEGLRVLTCAHPIQLLILVRATCPSHPSATQIEVRIMVHSACHHCVALLFLGVVRSTAPGGGFLQRPSKAGADQMIDVFCSDTSVLAKGLTSDVNASQPPRCWQLQLSKTNAHSWVATRAQGDPQIATHPM